MSVTRQEYMDGKVTHRAYYAQFVNDRVKQSVLHFIGKAALLASTDEHLNDIPLKEWDKLGAVGTAQQWKDTGEWPSLAGYVCIYKEAARQLIEGFRHAFDKEKNQGLQDAANARIMEIDGQLAFVRRVLLASDSVDKSSFPDNVRRVSGLEDRPQYLTEEKRLLSEYDAQITVLDELELEAANAGAEVQS